MPTRRQELAWAYDNAVRRPGPDDQYADGDDAVWMHVDWPSLTRRVPVLGRSVNVVDTGGSGPPLLFIHGLGGCWQNWLLNIPAFMGSHRVIALDLPGFGESEMPAEEISIRVKVDGDGEAALEGRPGRQVFTGPGDLPPVLFLPADARAERFDCSRNTRGFGRGFDSRRLHQLG